jgi:hypothetical protein
MAAAHPIKKGGLDAIGGGKVTMAPLTPLGEENSIALHQKTLAQTGSRGNHRPHSAGLLLTRLQLQIIL